MASSRTTEHTYYVETAPGLEEVTWLEIRRRLPQAQFREFHFARDERGIALFDLAAPPGAIFSLRTINAAFLTAAYLANTSRGYRDLRQLREQMVRSGDFGRAANAFSRHRRRQIASYRLIVRTYGKHEYNRQAVRRAVIQGIEAVYPAWQRAQDEPDVELWANVLGSTILLGMRLPFHAPAQGDDAAALPGLVAEALVLLSDPDKSDHFLDPFPASGAIVAARGSYPAAHLTVGAGWSDGAAAMAQLGHGDDVSPATVRWDGSQLALPEQAVNKVVTHMPSVEPHAIHEQYGSWLQELQRVLQVGGRAVIFTHAYEQFKAAIRQAPLLEIRGGYSLTVGDRWGRIYLLQRLDTGS